MSATNAEHTRTLATGCVETSLASWRDCNNTRCDRRASRRMRVILGLVAGLVMFTTARHRTDTTSVVNRGGYDDLY